MDEIMCEVCEQKLTEDEACYRYLGDNDEFFCNEQDNASELHTFCEVHAPDCSDGE